MSKKINMKVINGLLSIKVCKACSRPKTPNGRCGCVNNEPKKRVTFGAKLSAK